MITIKVRMDDGGTPQISVSAIVEYFHEQQDELATATTTPGVSVPDAYVDAITAALQNAIESVRVDAEKAGRRGAIRSAAAAERQAE